MKDVEIIGMIKTYIQQTLVGMGALKGAPCTVQGVVDEGDGTQVLTLKWTDDDGVAHTTDISLPSAVFELVNPTNGQTIRYNSTSGKWENSNVSFSADLGDLDDVVITSVTDGQVLTYDAANNRWINADGSTVASMADLTDVTITTVQNGQILVYNSTSQKWENKTLNIDDLGNVQITSATDGQILAYNNTSGKWENKTLTAAGVEYDGTESGLSATDTQGAIDELADEKVDKVSGKGLSANDFTDALKTKLDGIEDGAEVNDIDTVKVNGTALVPDANKAVNILLNMTKLSDVDLTDIADGMILIYDATNNKWIVGPNTGATYTAGDGIEIDSNNKISSKIVLFTGTEAQWNALTLAEKIKFTHYATNDDQTGQIDAVPTQNSANLMTSGGIYNALQGKANTTDLGTAAAKDSTNAVTQNSTDLVESGAVYTGLAAKANTSDLGTAAAKDSTNAVTQNSTDLVESGAVYTGLAGKANTSDLGTAAAKDSTNAITQNSTALVESGAVYSAINDFTSGNTDLTGVSWVKIGRVVILSVKGHNNSGSSALQETITGAPVPLNGTYELAVTMNADPTNGIAGYIQVQNTAITMKTYAGMNAFGSLVYFSAS